MNYVSLADFGVQLYIHFQPVNLHRHVRAAPAKPLPRERYLRGIWIYAAQRTTNQGTGAGTLPATETLQVRDTMCFTMCPCISPDLDGYRAPKMKQRPRKTKSRSIRIRFCGQIKTIQIKKIESDQIHCPWLQPVEICLGDFFVA
jgi:hypothetical protein